MTLLLVGLGTVALVLPGLRPSLSLRGDPRWFVPLDTATLTFGLAAVAAGLGLSAAVGAAHVVASGSLMRFEGHVAPGGIMLSGLSALLLGLLAGRFAVTVCRARRGRRIAHADGWLGQHHDHGDHELVVLPTTAPVAYSVHGSPAQVVISEGLRDRLSSDLFAFVIDHERAHLRRRHRRSLLLAAYTDALFGRIPAIARSTLALRLAVECAADEDAAGWHPQHRRDVATALHALGDASWLPGGGRESLRFRAGQLISPRPSRAARFEIVAATGLAVLAVVTTVVAGHVGGDLPAHMAALR